MPTRPMRPALLHHPPVDRALPTFSPRNPSARTGKGRDLIVALIVVLFFPAAVLNHRDARFEA